MELTQDHLRAGPGESPVKQLSQAWKLIFQECIVTSDKHGNNQFAVKLWDVNVIPESHYNLISLTKLMEEGHKVIGNKKDGLSVEKGGRSIKFDIRVETPKGVL